MSAAFTTMASSWLDEDTWQVTVPLDDGMNAFELLAIDLYEDIASSDTVTVAAETGD